VSASLNQPMLAERLASIDIRDVSIAELGEQWSGHPDADYPRSIPQAQIKQISFSHPY
jgi:hypothetical protein